MTDQILHVSLRVDGSRIFAEVRVLSDNGVATPRPPNNFALGDGCLEVVKRLQKCLHLGHDKHPDSSDWFTYLGRQLNGYLLADNRLRDRLRDRLRVGISQHDRVRILIEFAQDQQAQDEQQESHIDLPLEYLIVDDLEEGALTGAEAVVGTHQKLSVSRLIAAPESPVPPLKDHLRVLLIAAPMSEAGDVAPEEVQRTILEALGENDSVEFLPGSAIVDLIKRGKSLDASFDIVHFLGHSKQDDKGVTQLQFGTRNEDPFPVTPRKFAAVLRGSCRAVILQSCTTLRAAPSILAVGPHAVVAMQHPVPRDRSTIFMGKLYEGLAQNLAIDAAVQNARRDLHERDLGAFGAALLFVRKSDPIRFNTSQVRRHDAKRSVVRLLGATVADTPLPPSRRNEHEPIDEAGPHLASRAVESSPRPVLQGLKSVLDIQNANSGRRGPV